MLEIVLIRKLLTLDNYVKYRHHIKLKPDDKELKVLYSLLDDSMAEYNRDMTLDEFKLIVLHQYPEYDTLVEQIETTTIGDDVLQASIEDVVNRSVAYDLALDAIAVSEGKKPFTSILDFINQLENKEEVKPTEFVTDDLETLWNTTVHTPGLRWRLKTMNRMLGSLRKGDFGFVFARPETGKTTFLASEVTFMASQTDRPILWFNNEQEGQKVKVTMYRGALGIDLTELYSNRPKNMARYLTVTKSNILLKDDAELGRRQIERICKEINPALIIFDQIDKIKGFDDDREDLRLGAIYIWARELAKKYCPVIGICQADVSGENKRWLTMDNVANAKTAKQAEADWILGIGAVHDQGLEHIRYLHLSKNKMDGDEDSDPNLRHGRVEVKIRPEIARYEDL